VVVAVRLIEQIGSYAGIAAIPGLAVLSVLYFSQARDVRRLREWAGRAPERAAEQAAGGRVAAVQAQPAAKPAAAASAAAPAAAAATAGAKPATATAAPATASTAEKPAAAVAGAASTNGESATAPADADEKPETGEKAGAPEKEKEEEAAVAATTGAKPATPAGAAAAAAGGSSGSATGTATRPGPPAIAGVRPTRTIPRIPSGSQTSILTPTSASRDDGPWYRRLGARLPAARYIALIVAGVLVLGGGAAFGISQLAKEDTSSGGGGVAKEPEPSSSKDAPKSKERSTAAVDPADVTVTVVNGTTIAGLARDTASRLSGYGFQIGNKVTGTGSLAAAESVVLYKPGAEAEAKLVAEKLKIDPREPADADAIAQAGPASVIVVLGADQAPGG
jgi:hypothetical protein